jgi:hypothetical protein
MDNRITPAPKKRMPHPVVALLIGILISFIGGFLISEVYRFGGFSAWKSLSNPPSKATHISNIDVANLDIWVELDNGEKYATILYDNQWRLVDRPPNIDPYQDDFINSPYAK